MYFTFSRSVLRLLKSTPSNSFSSFLGGEPRSPAALRFPLFTVLHLTLQAVSPLEVDVLLRRPVFVCESDKMAGKASLQLSLGDVRVLPGVADSIAQSEALSSEPVVGGVAEEGDDSAMLQCDD